MQILPVIDIFETTAHRIPSPPNIPQKRKASPLTIIEPGKKKGAIINNPAAQMATHLTPPTPPLASTSKVNDMMDTM